MSLNWNIEACDKSKCFTFATKDEPADAIKVGDRLLTVPCSSAIWATMAIGIGHLTEKTIDEAIARCRILEAVNGAWMHRGVEGKDGETEIEDVYLWPLLRDFVGLKTNVGYESKTKWLNRIYAEAVRQAKHTK